MFSVYHVPNTLPSGRHRTVNKREGPCSVELSFEGIQTKHRTKTFQTMSSPNSNTRLFKDVNYNKVIPFFHKHTFERKDLILYEHI